MRANAEARLLFSGGTSPEDLEVYEDASTRWLQSRAGTVHSAMNLARPASLALPYTRTMTASLLFHSRPARVLQLGLGGASLARFLLHQFDRCRITAVEIDPLAIDLAARWFALSAEHPRLRIVEADARIAVDDLGDRFDLIQVDLFDAHGLPAWLRDGAYYRRCRELLRKHGIMVMNLWLVREEEFLAVLGDLRDAFDARCVLLDVDDHANIIALCFRDTPEHVEFSAIARRAAMLTTRFGIDYRAMLERMAALNPTQAGRLAF